MQLLLGMVPILLVIGVIAFAISIITYYTPLEEGACPRCRYSLKALVPDVRCPECGATAIERAHEARAQMEGRRGSIRAAWGVVGWLIVVPLVLAALIALAVALGR